VLLCLWYGPRVCNKISLCYYYYYLNLGLIWNICVAKVMMAQVIWAENIVVSRLEKNNCTLWPCPLIAATMLLTWSLVLHRSCQLLQMRCQLYRTLAFFCRVLHSAYRYFKTMLKEKFQARLLRGRSWNQFAPIGVASGGPKGPWPPKIFGNYSHFALHNTVTVNLALVQCQCHTVK